MAHYCTLVIVPAEEQTDPETLMRYLDGILAPYNQNLTVASHLETCDCRGWKARLRANALAKQELSVEELQASIDAKYLSIFDGLAKEGRFEELWDLQEAVHAEHFKPLYEARDRALAASSDKDAPDPECDLCGGHGHFTTDRSPRARWDFWFIGGRFDGYICGTPEPIDPRLTDPKHRHPDHSRLAIAAFRAQHEHKDLNNNRLSMAAIRAQISTLIKLDPNKLVLPSAIVTADGTWHGYDDLEVPEFVGDFGKRRRWRRRAREILDQAADDCVVIACDMHT